VKHALSLIFMHRVVF